MQHNSLGVEIIPAILVKSYDDMVTSLAALKGQAALVQIDVVDGVYVPSKTWPYTTRAHFDSLVAGDEGLPYWDSIDFEFDLMVAKPSEVIEQYMALGASRLVVHLEEQDVLDALGKLQTARADDAAPLQVGIALPAAATAERLKPFEGFFDYVQVMGIEHIGQQGQVFSKQALDTVRAVRGLYPHISIQVDGGVTTDTIGSILEAGASRLVVGSAIFASTDPAQEFQNIQHAIRVYTT